MPFEHSCFISYRHSTSKLAERIIDDLAEALNNELAVSIGIGPCVDHRRLEGGDFYNELLAADLCKSVCLVMVFTPIYFDPQYPYCAREYKAMEKLEKVRLNALMNPADKQHGLIIPIVFRGVDALPQEIKGRRQYYDFSSFTLVDRPMSRHPRYAREIKKIADYITARYSAMATLPDDPCKGCEAFAIPTYDEIRKWLNEVKGGTSPFPMRELG